MTQPLAPAVSAGIALQCDDDFGRPMSFTATFGYSAADPWAVTITFHVPSGDVVWMVSRDLLHEGQLHPVGEGDVRLHPVLDESGAQAVELEFRSPEGTLRADARVVDLERFLDRTWRLVPPGREQVDVDELVAALIGG